MHVGNVYSCNISRPTAFYEHFLKHEKTRRSLNVSFGLWYRGCFGVLRGISSPPDPLPEFTHFVNFFNILYKKLKKKENLKDYFK